MSLFGLIKRAKPAPPPGQATIEPVMRELPPPPALTTPEDVRRMLFEAVAERDEARLAELCRDHRATIDQYLPEWEAIPDALRANPVAAEWYARGLDLLRRFCVPASA
jgi:hypothetical protein